MTAKPRTDPDAPAFPSRHETGASGLTKREYMAALALQGLMANGRAQLAAREAVRYTDELIEELNR